MKANSQDKCNPAYYIMLCFYNFLFLFSVSCLLSPFSDGDFQISLLTRLSGSSVLIFKCFLSFLSDFIYSCFSSCVLSLSSLYFFPYDSLLLIHGISLFSFPCWYLRLFPPLLEAGFGVLVETIWQWTVPSSNMSQMAPNTSVAGIPWGWGMVTYSTAAATAGGERMEHALQHYELRK